MSNILSFGGVDIEEINDQINDLSGDIDQINNNLNQVKNHFISEQFN